MAFRECCNLKTLQLNDGIKELGWFCLWRTGITDLSLPPHIKMTREQLGLDQEDQKILRLPHGLEVVGNKWFSLATIEKLIVPSCVKVLGESAFIMCERLSEVIFEPNSRLERIEACCFDRCNLTKIVLPESVQYIGEFCFSDSLSLREVVIPKSVRKIDGFAFSRCRNLSSLVF